MRNLFLALLLANLGFAAWHAWFSRTHDGGARLEDEGAGITLVKELDERKSGGSTPEKIGSVSVPAGASASAVSKEAPASAAAVSKEAPAGASAVAVSNEVAAGPSGGGSVAARHLLNGADAAPKPDSGASSREALPLKGCVSVGPFRELAQAATASAKLRNAGYSPSQRAGEGDVLVGYWVYLEGVKPGKEADGVLAKLHANGVPDSYFIPSDDGNRISLGVFTDVVRANRLRDQVRALGFDPVVGDRKRREDVYWIDLSVPSGRQVDFSALQTPGQINRLEELPCSATGGA